MKKFVLLIFLSLGFYYANGQTVINLADQCNCEIKKPGTVVMPGDTANGGSNQGDLLVDANGSIFYWNGSSWQLPNLGGSGTDNDQDSTNELQTLSISNDTLYLSNGNSIYLGSISGDNDQDSTNELNTSFVINGSNLEITDAGGTLSIPLSSIQIDTTSLSARIDTNAANLAAHIANDLDIDSTNESNQTFVINGTNLEITDNNGTLSVPLTSIQIDTTSLSARIDTNAANLAAHIANDLDIDSTNESNQTFVINGTNLEITDNNGTLSVPLTSIQIDTTSLSARIDTNAANIAAHIANDLDIDSTNESNQTFVINGTNLEITDNNGTLSVPLTSIQIDTTSLSARIDTNAANLAAHIANDLDIDSTNESNQTFVINGTNLEITDNNGTLSVPLTSIQIDTTSLSNRIIVNADSIDVVAADLANHIATDLDIDSTNESNQTFVINGTNLEITDNNGTLSVPLTSIQIDTTSLSNRIIANADSIDVVAADLANHIATDLDIDSTNESNQTFVINGTNLEIADNNGTLSVPLTSIQIDTTSLSARIDTNAANLAAHIANDLDIDSTNESNQTFVINGTNLEITDNNGTLSVPLTSIQIDTTSLSNRIIANADSIDVVAADLANHIATDLDIDSTNESNQTFVINGTNLEITDNNGTLSVPLTSIQIDTTSLSARIDTNAANIAAHIANDLDIDSTNESNQTFVINGTNLEITDNNGTLSVPLTSIQIDTTSLSNRIIANADSIDVVAADLANHIATDLDIDSTNELITAVTYSNDSLNITEGAITFSVIIPAEDSTNELIDSIVVNVDSTHIYQNNGTPVSAENPMRIFKGTFIINATGNVTITGLPFKPKMIEFKAYANVDANTIDADNGVGNNNNTAQNSFGFMDGYVQDYNGTITQQVICSGGNGNSINDISRFASPIHCIGIRYGNQNGDDVGKTTAKFVAFTADGFTIDVDEKDDNLLIIYTAHR